MLFEFVPNHVSLGDLAWAIIGLLALNDELVDSTLFTHIDNTT